MELKVSLVLLAVIGDYGPCTGAGTHLSANRFGHMPLAPRPLFDAHNGTIGTLKPRPTSSVRFKLHKFAGLFITSQGRLSEGESQCK